MHVCPVSLDVQDLRRIYIVLLAKKDELNNLLIDCPPWLLPDDISKELKEIEFLIQKMRFAL